MKKVIEIACKIITFIVVTAAIVAFIATKFHRHEKEQKRQPASTTLYTGDVSPD